MTNRDAKYYRRGCLTGFLVAVAGMLCGSHLTGCSAQAQEPAKKSHVFFDRANVALFTTDALVRTLDAQSTRSFMTNPCGCMIETSLPQSVAASTPTMYGYSVGVTGAMVALSYAAHRTGHHKLERWIPAADAGYDGRIVVENWQHIARANRLYTTTAAPR